MAFADLSFEPKDAREHLLAWRIPEAIAAYSEAMAKTNDPTWGDRQLLVTE